MREATVIKAVTGMVDTFRVGERVLVKEQYGDRCTVEKPGGFRTMVWVPVSHLEIEVDYDDVPDEWRRA